MASSSRPHATTRRGVRILPTNEALSFHGHEGPGEQVDWVEEDEDGANVHLLRWHPSLGPRERWSADDGPIAG